MCIQVMVWWKAYQLDEFIDFVIVQLEYLMSGLMDPALVQKSVEAIAQMDRQLEPWKNGKRQSKQRANRSG